MKKLGTEAFEEIRTWMYRNAKPLDMALWQFYFEKGSRDEVIRRLAFYQNEDGGFGNGLEPDCWNGESTPYTTLIAAGLLREIGFEEASHPVVQGMLRYLESGRYSSEDGWFFCIPSNDHCPHAPWWTYSEESNALQGLGITAGLAAFIFHYADRNSAIFARAAVYTDRILENLDRVSDFGEMGIGSIAVLIQDIEECGLDSRFKCFGIKERLTEAASRAIERDPAKWALYTPRPSEFISSPDSIFYPGNEAIVEQELDYLIDTRNPGGVWNITWSWFDLGEKYAKEFAVSENWWMASKAMEKIRFLENFGRI